MPKNCLTLSQRLLESRYNRRFCQFCNRFLFIYYQHALCKLPVLLNIFEILSVSVYLHIYSSIVFLPEILNQVCKNLTSRAYDNVLDARLCIFFHFPHHLNTMQHADFLIVSIIYKNRGFRFFYYKY